MSYLKVKDAKRAGVALMAALAIAVAGALTATSKSHAATTFSVVSFGDSLTWGAGSGSSDSPGADGPSGNGYEGDSYPAQLGALSGWSVTNQGINGDAVTQPSVNDPLHGSNRFQDVVNAEPSGTTFVVWEGTNDVLAGKAGSAIVSGYTQMIAAAHAAGDKIFLATLPPIAGLTSTQITQRQNTNNWIRQGHGQDGTLDLESVVGSTPTTMNPAYAANGETVNPITSVPHLNVIGYAAVAQAVYKGILNPRVVYPQVSYLLGRTSGVQLAA